MAADAVAQAGARLRERGVDPKACPKLLAALRHAVEQTIAAVEHGRDVGDYRRFLDEAYARLDVDPVVDEPPSPPKRTLNTSRWGRPGGVRARRAGTL